ncbi:MAG: FAD-dependent monooxygenase [Adhaeribacter sp.]
MHLTSEAAVLIVGAGPTGLMLACQLALRRIPFRLIDRKPGPTPTSNALVLQARSLEIFEQMGLAGQVLDQGHTASGLNFMVRGRWVQHISLQAQGQAFTSFPYVCLLEQSKTESLLLEFLAQYHLQVEWNTELIHVEQSPEGVQALLRFKDLKEQAADFPWVVGADGAGSQVRQQTGIPFLGGGQEYSCLVADTTVEWNFAPQEIFLCQNRGLLAGFFPLAGEKRYRLVTLKPGKQGNQTDLDFDKVSSELERKLGFPLRFRQTGWQATYHLQHRYAGQLRQGRCFLAGDAAQVHNPIGGQGLNTGLQDAYNLAWKLALVIHQAAGEELLDTYQQERLPLARRTVRATELATHFLTGSNVLSQFSRKHILPLVLRKAFRYNPLRSQVFRLLSQTGIGYPRSPLSVAAKGSNHFPGQAPQPGDRVPSAPVYLPDLGGRRNLYELLRSPYFTLLVFKSSFSTDRAEQLVDELEQALETAFPDLLATVLLYPHEKNNALFQQFGIAEDAFYLIRPDNHIAFRSQPAQVSSLLDYLQQTLGVPMPAAEEPSDLENLFDPAFD